MSLKKYYCSFIMLLGSLAYCVLAQADPADDMPKGQCPPVASLISGDGKSAQWVEKLPEGWVLDNKQPLQAPANGDPIIAAFTSLIAYNQRSHLACVYHQTPIMTTKGYLVIYTNRSITLPIEKINVDPQGARAPVGWYKYSQRPNKYYCSAVYHDPKWGDFALNKPEICYWPENQ